MKLIAEKLVVNNAGLMFGPLIYGLNSELQLTQLMLYRNQTTAALQDIIVIMID